MRNGEPVLWPKFCFLRKLASDGIQESSHYTKTVASREIFSQILHMKTGKDYMSFSERGITFILKIGEKLLIDAFDAVRAEISTPR